jgi:hypothetical protein
MVGFGPLELPGETFARKSGRYSAWFLSLLMHLALVVVLSLITFSEVIRLPFVIESGISSEPEALVSYSISAPSEKVETTTTEQSMAAAVTQVSGALAGAASTSNALTEQISREFSGPGSSSSEQVMAFDLSELSRPVRVAGTMTRANGIEGAIDLLTEEIAKSVQEGPTRVVWILDVSPSMSEYRRAIADRLETIYSQLRAMNLPVDRSLDTAVMAFDERPHALSPTVSQKPSALRDLIHRLPSTESGIKNTYLAVMNARNRFGPAKEKIPRRTMFVVVTDEEGSDLFKSLDHCIELMQQDHIRCFVIGKSTVLGRPVIESHRFGPSGQQYISVVEPGLESAFLEFMDPASHSSFSYGLAPVLTGEAPYGLKRLCLETGGMFLMSSTDIDPSVDSNTIREFQPLYGDRPTVRRSLQFDPFRSGLVSIAESNGKVELGVVQVRFSVNSNLILEGMTLPEARSQVTAFDNALVRNLKALQALAPQRTRVRDRRSLANFDLCVALTVAQRSYSQSYLGVLNRISQPNARPKDPSHNIWLLVNSIEDEGGPAAAQLREQARDMLAAVIESYPGTPWALRARNEMDGIYAKGWQISSYKVRVSPGVPPPRTPSPPPIRQNL